MTSDTQAKIDAVLLALEWNQMKGLAPHPGSPDLTPEYLCALSHAVQVPVGITTWRRLFDRSLQKAALALPALEALAHLRSRKKPTVTP